MLNQQKMTEYGDAMYAILGNISRTSASAQSNLDTLRIIDDLPETSLVKTATMETIAPKISALFLLDMTSLKLHVTEVDNLVRDLAEDIDAYSSDLTMAALHADGPCPDCGEYHN